MPRKKEKSAEKELEILQAQIDLLDEMMVLERRAMNERISLMTAVQVIVTMGLVLSFLV